MVDHQPSDEPPMSKVVSNEEATKDDVLEDVVLGEVVSGEVVFGAKSAVGFRAVKFPTIFTKPASGRKNRNSTLPFSSSVVMVAVYEKLTMKTPCQSGGRGIFSGGIVGGFDFPTQKPRWRYTSRLVGGRYRKDW